MRIAVPDPDVDIKFSEFKALSPFETLQGIYCGKGYGGLGLRYKFENNVVGVSEVFFGSPAEKAGLRANDVVTHIDNEPVLGLTQQQIIEKSRGPVDTNVVLTVLRAGQDKPLNITVVREKILMRPAQLEPPQ